MIFKIEHNSTIIASLRRKWRKSRRFTMRVTHSGTISVIRMPLHKDMKTEAQLRCRARFIKAQEMMLDALNDKKKIRFFRKRQLRLNYKTLRGCIRAYYIAELIDKERQDTIDEMAQKMSFVLSDVERNIPDVTSDVFSIEMPKSFDESVKRIDGTSNNDVMLSLRYETDDIEDDDG